LGSESKRKEKQSQGGEGGRWVFAVRTCMTNVDWAAMLPMATQAAIAGVIVGCVPPLRHLLHGPGAPLQIVSDAISLLGDGLVPAAIPLLGAVLYRGPGASRLPWHVTAGVVATRLLIQPALLTGVVVLFLRVRAFDVPDPMFLMTMLLANATPTAINLQMVTVLYGHGAEEMSQLLFWQYLSSLASLPLFIRLFLAIIDKYT